MWRRATGFALKAVRLGADHGAAGVEVLAGLSAGDRVALDPVRPVWRAPGLQALPLATVKPASAAR